MLNNLRLAIAPVQSTPQAFNLRPPAANTEDAFKNCCAASTKTKDIEMKLTPKLSQVQLIILHWTLSKRKLTRQYPDANYVYSTGAITHDTAHTR